MFGDDGVSPCLPHALARSLTAANQAGLREGIPRSRSLAERMQQHNGASQRLGQNWSPKSGLPHTLTPPQISASVVAGGHETGRWWCYCGVIVCGVVGR
jgi:hypothetical protein